MLIFTKIRKLNSNIFSSVMSIETQFWFSVTKKKILDFKTLCKKDFGFWIWNQFFPRILDFDLKSFRCRILSNPNASTVLSVLHLHLLVLVPYFAACSALFAQIREYGYKFFGLQNSKRWNFHGMVQCYRLMLRIAVTLHSDFLHLVTSSPTALVTQRCYIMSVPTLIGLKQAKRYFCPFSYNYTKFWKDKLKQSLEQLLKFPHTTYV